MSAFPPSKMLPLQTLEPARNGVILRDAAQKALGQTSPHDDVCSWDDSKVASWIARVKNRHAPFLIWPVHDSRFSARCKPNKVSVETLDNAFLLPGDPWP